MEELQEFSAAEVASHKSKNNCWLTIHGKVYDVSEFLDHPGGDEILIRYSGLGGATKSFEEVRGHHSSRTTSMMDQYLIGKLDNYDPINASATTAQQRRRPDIGLVNYINELLWVGFIFAACYYLTFLNKA